MNDTCLDFGAIRCAVVPYSLWVLWLIDFVSVFFRGFRGHNIRQIQIEKTLLHADQSLQLVDDVFHFAGGELGKPFGLDTVNRDRAAVLG